LIIQILIIILLILRFANEWRDTMTICQKCGKIFLKSANVCDVCNSNELSKVDEYSLIDYECKYCKSMYKNKIEVCPNCGSKTIEEKSSKRIISSNPNKYNVTFPIDTSRFEKINSLLEALNSICDGIRIVLGIFFITIGLVLLRDNSNILFLSVMIFAFFFCIITGFLSLNNAGKNWTLYVRLLYYFVILFLSHFDTDPAVFYVSLGTIILYIIVTIIQQFIIPKIKLVNNDELKLIKEKHKKLINNGILFLNLDYELIPAMNKNYYLRVVIKNPSGVVVAFQSKQVYSTIDFETVNLLLDIEDNSNYYIYAGNHSGALRAP